MGKRLPKILLALSVGLLLAAFINCSNSSDPSSGNQNVSEGTSHLKYFGYVGIDCGLDDPHDASTKTNYADEVSSFSNIAHVCVYGPTDDLRARLEHLKAHGLKSVLDFHGLFYELKGSGTAGGSGVNYDLYADHANRWNRFLNLNRSVLTPEYIAALYPADEPTWLGIFYAELDPVVSTLRSGRISARSYG